MSAVVLFALCGCSNDGMTDTYWRNDKTGEWLIGFTENKVIYDCKVWEILSQADSKDASTIMAENGGVRLVVKMGKDEDGRRIITIGDTQAECSFIDGTYLPDQQEQAVESYIGVHGYPTYKLVDPRGNLHDLSFPLNVDEVEDMMKRMLK
jgi:hypothetical protein